MTMHFQVFAPRAGPACDPHSGQPCTPVRDRVGCPACLASPEFAEAEFAARHSVLSDADVAWARALNAERSTRQ